MCIINDLLNMNNKRNCSDCEQAKQTFLELSSKLHSDNEKYTTLVLSIGYVSYISLLASSFEKLYVTGKWLWFICIVLIILSLGLFIGYEIWKIKISHKYQDDIYNKISEVLDENVHFSYTHLKSTVETIKFKHYSNIKNATKWIFNACVVTAILSGIMFFVCLGIVFSII